MFGQDIVFISTISTNKNQSANLVLSLSWRRRAPKKDLLTKNVTTSVDEFLGYKSWFMSDVFDRTIEFGYLRYSRVPNNSQDLIGVWVRNFYDNLNINDPIIVYFLTA